MSSLFSAPRAALLLLSLSASLTPALAAGISASSASFASSASVGSVSDSFGASSNSSSKTTQVAEGEYRILAVAPAERAGAVQLSLQAVDAPAAAPLLLTLPRAALDAQALAAGDVVSARHRPFGIEFARADTRSAFYLVLQDEWFRELQPHALSL